MSDTHDILEEFTPLFAPQDRRGRSARRPRATRCRTSSSAAYASSASKARSIPIHPSAPEIDGLPAYKSLADTPRAGRLRVHRDRRPRRSRRCSRSANGRLRFAQVISSGFGEVEEGRELQDALVRGRARRRRAPASARTASACTRRAARSRSPRSARRKSARSASFRRAAASAPTSSAAGFARGLKFSGLVTVGNCADVTPSDLLEFYLADEQTRVIGMYIETAQRRPAPVRDPARRARAQAGRRS